MSILARQAAVRAACALAALSLSGPTAAETPPALAAGQQATGQTLVLHTHDRKPDLKDLAKEPCFTVREVRIDGVELVGLEPIRAKVKPFAYRCLGNSLAKAIVGALNEAHVDKGFATTQGYLPDQDIRKTGVLAIKVVTGRIDKVIYREEAGTEGLGLADRLGKAWQPVREHKGPWGLVNALSGLVDTLDDPLDRFQILDGATLPGVKRWLALGLQEGDVLSVDAIQEGIDVLNKLPSNRAEAKLAPGSQPATSTVEIVNKHRDSFRLTAGYEINGTDLNDSGNTVASRLRIDMAKDNLIGINDSWSTSFASGLDSNEVRGRFSLPWRRFSFAIDGGYSEQLSAITKGASLFYQSGNVSGSLSYLLERSKAYQTTLDASLGWRQVDRHINSLRLTPQKVAPVRLGVSRIHYFEGGNEGLLLGSQLSYGLGLSRGLTIWDATRDDPRPDPSAPRAQFWKLDGSFGFAQGLRDLGIARIDVSGQWTSHPLYSDDQLTLGSSSTIRGFTNTAAKVDRGAVLRAEFAPALPIGKLKLDKEQWPFLDDMLRALQPYAFADLGHGRDLANARDLTRASLGAGLRYAYGRTSLDVSLAHPIVERGTPRLQRGPEIYFTLNTKLM